MGNYPKSIRPSTAPIETFEYKGVGIDKFENGVFIGDQRFHALFSAQGYIDKMIDDSGGPVSSS